MLANDPIIMRQHKDLYICVRDQYSFDFLKRYRFCKNILLLPDMAFCIDFCNLSNFVLPETDRVLLFKRKDKENADTSNIVPEDYSKVLDVEDWPGYEVPTEGFLELKERIKEHRLAEADEYAVNSYLPQRLKDGIQMISPYKLVYSNRLHGSILSILLGKDVTIIDNSYGKNAQFYDTWLTDIPNVSIRRVSHVHDLRRTMRLCITWLCAQLGIKL